MTSTHLGLTVNPRLLPGMGQVRRAIPGIQVSLFERSTYTDPRCSRPHCCLLGLSWEGLQRITFSILFLDF